jgi:hypothetical protein
VRTEKPNAAAGSPRRRLDRFDRDLLVFWLSWAPYGGPPADECFVEFGMSIERVRERCMEVVWTARAAEYDDTDCSLLLRGSRLLAGLVQRDRRSAAEVARPRVKRFTRRAVSPRSLLGGDAVIGRTVI